METKEQILEKFKSKLDLFQLEIHKLDINNSAAVDLIEALYKEYRK